MLIAVGLLLYFEILNTIVPPSSAAQHGVTQYIFKDINGKEVSALTSDSDFPNNPDSVNVLNEFQSPEEQFDDFGQRLVSYFKAPVTGDYTFYVICDEKCIVNLSTDETEANKEEIIDFGGKARKDEWTRKGAEQRSSPKALTAGHKYFLEALHKDAGGYDIVGVAVKFPNSTMDKPISNQYLYIDSFPEEISSSFSVTSSLLVSNSLESAFISTAVILSSSAVVSSVKSSSTTSPVMFTSSAMTSSIGKLLSVTLSTASSYVHFTSLAMTSSNVKLVSVTRSIGSSYTQHTSSIIPSSSINVGVSTSRSSLGGYFRFEGQVVLFSSSQRTAVAASCWVSCGVFCLQDNKCVSFSLNRKTRKCFLYHVTAKSLPRSEIFHSTNVLYYERI